MFQNAEQTVQKFGIMFGKFFFWQFWVNKGFSFDRKGAAQRISFENFF